MNLWSLNARRMADLLHKREVSSAELVRAHLDRILELDAPLRAFTHVFRERALQEARGADERRKKGEELGALDGLPISVKESLDAEGLASTMGVPSRVSHRATSDAGIVKHVRGMGAVVLGRTNISQYLIFHESRNPLFGQCANPWDLGRTPGGSSGGEGAAIAAGLSPLGIGTDIGGSIRVPAHFCGIAGLKPTLDRWTNRGSNTALMGQEAIRGQCGPMARTSDDVAFFWESVDPVKLTALDGRVPPLPAGRSSAVDVSKLRVAYYEDDGLVAPSLAVARGVRRAADAMRARGAEVIAWKPPRLEEHVYLYFAAMSADGGAMMRRGLEGGDVDPVIAALRRGAELPTTIRLGLARALSLAGQDKLARLLEAVGEKTVDKFWQITNQLRAYRMELTDAMDRAGIDVVLCPAHATPALPHLGAKDFVLAGSACMLWNIVQFPGGVVPVTRVLRDEARRDGPRDRLESMAAKVDQGSAGLPIGVQVVARMWREDLVLAAMRAIEDEARKDADFPKTPTNP